MTPACQFAVLVTHPDSLYVWTSFPALLLYLTVLCPIGAFIYWCHNRKQAKR